MAEVSKIYEATTTAPVNIAVIKYWGKRDSKLNLPTNSSISVTLSQDDLCSKTTIRVSSTFPRDQMWLNGIEQDISNNSRLLKCLMELRQIRKNLIELKDSNLPKLSEFGLRIISENNFPTAAGLASSASGFACLVKCLSLVYELPLNIQELSKISRLGSGSACRSLYGGFVLWNMGELKDGKDSFALQIKDEKYWPELNALICVISDLKKGTGSTIGMEETIKTSLLMKERVKIVPHRIEEMISAIKEKDFEKFSNLTMKDSNQFHSVCLDTFPPIFYLNDISRGIISLVHEINRSVGKNIVAYTFDAGPNAVLYVLKENIKIILEILQRYFPNSKFQDKKNILLNQNDIKTLIDFEVFNENIIPVFPSGSIKEIIHTNVGDGPRILSKEEALKIER